MNTEEKIGWEKDAKRDYLIRTFSRTKRKDYENYIINAIWFKLGRDDIQPVTQQYVRRSDNKYALIDLYFPQINVGIECDEFYHTGNNDNDAERQNDIEKAIDNMKMEDMLSVVELAGMEFIRIEAHKSMEDINKQIDDAVNKIKDKIAEQEKKGNFKRWDAYREASEIAIEKKSISVNDKLMFRTIQEIAKCFGYTCKNWKSWRRCWFKVEKSDKIGNLRRYNILCPKLAIKNDSGEELPQASDWKNTLSKDGNKLYESNATRIVKEYKKINESQIVFAKSSDALGRNAYKFLGIYKFYKLENNCRIYERIAEKIDLPTLD